MRVAVLMLWALVASAHQSIVLTGTATGAATLPNAAPWINQSTLRIEWRMNSIASVSSQAYVWWFASGDIWAALLTNGSIRIFDGGTFCDLAPAGATDVVLRFQRIVGQARTCEMWNSITGVRITSANADTAASARSINGGMIVGDANTRTQLAFLRVFDTSVAVNSAAPSSNDSAPNTAFGDWRFEGNGTASAGGTNLTVSSGSYATTPAVLPTAIITQTGSAPSWVNGTGYGLARAASEASFSAADSSSDTTLTYRWAITAGPAIPTLTSYTASTTAFTPPLFGQYTLVLTIRDEEGQTSTATTKVGATAADATSGAIVPGISSDLMDLVGPLTRSGTGAWTWLDKTEFQYATGMVSKLPTVAWPFDTALDGTISMTQNVTTITGSGTTFQSTFACNGTDYIVVMYQIPLTALIGRRSLLVTGCASDTSLTVSQAPIEFTGTQTGRSYGKATAADMSAWTNGSANWNYYDVGVALYRAYFKTGLTDVRDTARDLIDKWAVFPLDQGYACTPGFYACPSRRILALFGVMARAMDGRPELWPMIWQLADNQFSFFSGLLNNTRTDYDVRELGYQTWWYATLARVYADPSTQVAVRADALAKAQQWGDELWRYKQANVVGTGRSVADGGWAMTLDPGQGYTGAGNLPWQQGFPIRALLALYRVDPQAKWLAAAKAALDQMDLIAACGGSAYSVYYTTCDGGACGTCAYGGSIGTISCTGADFPCATSGALSNRYLSGEYISTYAEYGRLASDLTYISKANQLLAYAYGKEGGTLTDGVWMTDFSLDLPVNSGSWGQAGKVYGFTLGVGAGNQALGLAADPYSADTRTVTLSYVAPAGTSATSATYVAPSGASSTISCSAGACSLPTDYRQGNYLYRLTHTVTGGTMAGDLLPLKLQ